MKQETQQAEQVEQARVNQTPTTRVKGTPKTLVYAGDLRAAQNGTSFGVVFDADSFSVVEGTLVRNSKKPDGQVTIANDEGKRSTDYRVVDLNDEGTTTIEVGGETFVTDRAGNQYEVVDGVDDGDEEVIIWYNTVSGNRIGRILDFNGVPFAAYKEDGYLLKGLIQVSEEWRNANGARKKELKDAGLAPRVARFPVLRDDISEVEIEISRWNGGRMYEAHVFDADGEELEFKYDEGNADDVLSENNYTMSLEHGDGWQDKPANAQEQARTFNISIGEPSEDGLTQTGENFVQSVVSALEGTELTPEQAFAGGIEGLMQDHNVTDDVTAVRAAVYERVSHLDTDDL